MISTPDRSITSRLIDEAMTAGARRTTACAALQISERTLRRIYEIARKHCGAQASWSISLDALRIKVGSDNVLRDFRRMLPNIVKNDAIESYMPDYSIRLADDTVTFLNRGSVIDVGAIAIGPLSTDSL